MADLIIHYKSQGQTYTMTVLGYTGTRSVTDVEYYDGETYRDGDWLLPQSSAITAEDDGTAGTGGKHRLPDNMMHVAPRYKQKKRTMVTWTGTAGAYFRCWLDQVLSESLAAPVALD